MAKDLLLEIGTEEIPSGFITPARENMKEAAAKLLADNRLNYKAVKIYTTPRRLVLYVESLAEKQEDVAREVVGPAKAVAYDAQGNPTKAAEGFARGQGVDVKKLKIKTTEKGEYVCAVLEEKGISTKNLLPELLPKFIFSLTFPKFMRWSDCNLRFVRPIHWLLALYGGQVVKLDLEGIKADNKTYGHRFLSPGSVVVKDLKNYLAKLKKKYVLADQEERKTLILKQAKEAAQKVGGQLHYDEDLLDMVTNLVEYPWIIRGGFEKKYLELPPEVIITPMRKHQRYFPVVDKKGQLLPYFITASNMKVKNMKVVQEGNERVLKARLADALFFWREDRKNKLEFYLEELKRVVFQEKLGTVYEKAQRMTKLAGYLSQVLDPAVKDKAERAALLSKADLMTSMVYEFTELQGVMGRYYAELSLEDKLVAQAIEEHYLPRFTGDKIPQTIVGAITSMADKIDSIVGCFGVGLIPSGSEDPYALRRQAQGIVLTVIDSGYKISLSALIDQALEFLKDKITRSPQTVKAELVDFFGGRLKMILEERGIRYDLVEAALVVGYDDMDRAAKRARALADLRKARDFNQITTTFKRVGNILPKDFSGFVSIDLFREEAERKLYEEVRHLKEIVAKDVDTENFNAALSQIAKIRPTVDKFFNDVMVMAKEEELKRNRLALLTEVAGLFAEIADFTKVIAA
jgi:glycyl-tRNA synthetase beta chain